MSNLTSSSTSGKVETTIRWVWVTHNMGVGCLWVKKFQPTPTPTMGVGANPLWVTHTHAIHYSHISFYAQCGLKLEVPKIMPNWFLSLRGKKPRATEREHRFLSTSTKYEDTCIHVFFCNPG